MTIYTICIPANSVHIILPIIEYLGNIDLVLKHQNTKHTFKTVLEWLGEVQIPSWIAATASASRCSTWPCLCCFGRKWWGTPLGDSFSRVPVDGLVDIERVALPTVLRTKSVRWCTLVMNQVTEESWRMWCRGSQSRMENWNTSILILWCVWRCLKVRVNFSWAFSHLMLELWEVLKRSLYGWTRPQSLIRLVWQRNTYISTCVCL